MFLVENEIAKQIHEPESVLGNPPKVENLQHKWSFDKGVPENILTIVSSPNLACTQSPLSQMASLLRGGLRGQKHTKSWHCQNWVDPPLPPLRSA